MTGNSVSAWPSLPAGSALAADTGQEAACQHVLSWFRSAPWRHQPPREPGASPEVPPGGADRSAPSRDRRTGRFRQAPEQPPAPDDDAVLSLAAAADAAGPATGGPVRSRGRDLTGETMRSARPAPRPAEAAHVREIVFTATDHGEDCRCYRCHPYQRPDWRARSRRRRQ
jgi:hypothetical protein